MSFLLGVILLCTGPDLAAASSAQLVKVADVPLPGPPGRFDYAAADTRTGFLWLNQMGADRTLVFDPKTRRVADVVTGMATPTGITLVPERHLGFVSNAGGSRVTGRGSVAVVDLDTRRILSRAPAGRFPDGSAWAPTAGRLFVSDELGGTETVIGGEPLRTLRTVRLGGEAGMSAYDPISGRVLVNVQTRGQISAVDPRTMNIVERIALPPACRHNHGLLVDPRDRLAFVACDGNARLLVLALPALQPLQSPLTLGEEPDVLALDGTRRYLVVASESGVAAAFALAGNHVEPLWKGLVGPNAHVVAIDRRSGFLYFPLKNLGGKPTLRIMRLSPAR